MLTTAVRRYGTLLDHQAAWIIHPGLVTEWECVGSQVEDEVPCWMRLVYGQEMSGGLCSDVWRLLSLLSLSIASK